jgi:hypothetical protein
MDFQVLLLTIDNIMSEHSRTRRLTLLTLIDARVDTDNGEPDFVQSIRLYPGHHGEFWNVPKNKIHISEVYLRVPKKFRIFWYHFSLF